MLKGIHFIYILICLGPVLSCSKGGSGNPAQNPAPEAAQLISPLANSACLNGVSADGNKVTVRLDWNKAINADSYTVVITNLLSGKSISSPAESNRLDIALDGNQPYSWAVISKAAGTAKTAQSETWKFFLAGTPASNYAPFPATAIAPAANSVISSGNATSVSVQFTWSGADIDNDIAAYSFYMDDKDGSTKLADGLKDTTITRSISSHKIYYWKIVSSDKTGNESISQLFELIVN